MSETTQTYNLYIRHFTGSDNELSLTREKLLIVVNAYLYGKNKYTIKGKTKYIQEVTTLRIFTEDKQVNYPLWANDCYQMGYFKRKQGQASGYFLPKALLLIGVEVTEEFIGDYEYGALAKQDSEVNGSIGFYVDETRLKQLREIRSDKFDLTRLIKLCEELNSSYQSSNELSVGMLLRAVLDHVPPIFGIEKFVQVSSNYSGSGTSFKKLMNNLQLSFRNIADGLLHSTIRNSETLPTMVQVDFKSELDALLAEIIRILKY